MADIKKLCPFILKWEGGFVDDPFDTGGPTNMGVTLNTWQDIGYDKNEDGKIDIEDIKLITIEDVTEKILRVYWDRWLADRIKCQSHANILVDWVWASGKYGIIIPQRILGVRQDGIVGNKTLSALNNYPDSYQLFEKIREARISYVETICNKRPANKRFKKGWLNRIADLVFEEK